MSDEELLARRRARGRPAVPKVKKSWLRRATRVFGDWFTAQLMVLLFAFSRLLGPNLASLTGGAIARTIGPWIPISDTARANLALAMPELSSRERNRIVREVWDNLGRVAFEYPHLDRLYDFVTERFEPGRVEVDGIRYFQSLMWDEKPAIILTAHLANWELPAVCGDRHGLPTTIIFRPPSNRFVAANLMDVRQGTMGRLLSKSQGAVIQIAGAIEKGDHIGILIDQRFGAVQNATLFGQPAATNTVVARMARQFEMPVHGTRCIRLPGGRFRLEITPALVLPRDDDGKIDVNQATQAINGLIEDWVREYPGQWLWLHNRWALPKSKIKELASRP
ncbi:MAG: lipid A biosynthesis lauroyl acyltransferase [Pseudomonadota bacterium]